VEFVKVRQFIDAGAVEIVVCGLSGGPLRVLHIFNLATSNGAIGYARSFPLVLREPAYHLVNSTETNALDF
jgi:hypothetical protein